jgi:flagellar motility protein MotE (MotC chaperone)
MRIGPLNFIIASFVLVAGIKIGEVVISSDLIAKPSPTEGAVPHTTTPTVETPSTADAHTAKAADKPAVAPADGVSENPLFNPPQDTCLKGELLQASRDRMAQLEQKQREVDDRIRLMNVAEQRVQEQLARLEATREKISEAAQSAESKMGQDNAKLQQMYEQMKAKDAAEIFNEMDAQVAASLLRSMKEQKSSQILAAMEPKKAYDVTLMLSIHLKQDEKKMRGIIGDPAATTPPVPPVADPTKAQH